MTFMPRHDKPDDGRDDNADKKDDVPQSALGSLIGRFVNAVTATPGAAGLLLRAAERGDVAAVKAQLAAGVSPESVNASGETALHLAARRNHAEVVTVLLDAGAKAKAGIEQESHRHALFEAISFGSEEAAEVLIARGDYVLAADGTDVPLLQRACEKGKERIVAALLAAGADPLLPSTTGVSPLEAALEAKQSGIVMVLLQSPAVIAMVNQVLGSDASLFEGRTLFHLAIVRGDVALVDALLDAGAFVNRPNREGMTPLLLAIRRGDVDMVALLLARGADVQMPVTGRPPRLEQLQPAPLMYLCGLRKMNEFARAEMVRLLAAYGADVNAIDAESGEYPLHHLLSSTNIYAAMKALVAAGASVNYINRKGATPLMLSIECASVHEMTNLLAAGADPNARHRQDGRTALMIAAAMGQPERMAELIQAGADPRAVDDTGKSVLDYTRDNLRMASLTQPVIEAALARPPKNKPKPPGGLT